MPIPPNHFAGVILPSCSRMVFSSPRRAASFSLSSCMCSFFSCSKSDSSFACQGYRAKTWKPRAVEAMTKLVNEKPRVMIISTAFASLNLGLFDVYSVYFLLKASVAVSIGSFIFKFENAREHEKTHSPFVSPICARKYGVRMYRCAVRRTRDVVAGFGSINYKKRRVDVGRKKKGGVEVFIEPGILPVSACLGAGLSHDSPLGRGFGRNISPLFLGCRRGPKPCGVFRLPPTPKPTS